MHQLVQPFIAYAAGHNASAKEDARQADMTGQGIVRSLSPGFSGQNPIVELFCESTILSFIEL